MWRWSSRWHLFKRTSNVFSTYVEVILTREKFIRMSRRFLHVCGGDPTTRYKLLIWYLFSPRMWRWSYFACFLFLVIVVFSTYVEVILCSCNPWWHCDCFLHVCGGDPIFLSDVISPFKFSPRMWRWSYWLVDLDRANPVFSTYVGVILTITLVHDLKLYFLHKSGAKLTQWKKNHKQKSYNRGLFLFD